MGKSPSPSLCISFSCSIKLHMLQMDILNHLSSENGSEVMSDEIENRFMQFLFLFIYLFPGSKKGCLLEFLRQT